METHSLRELFLINFTKSIIEAKASAMNLSPQINKPEQMTMSLFKPEERPKIRMVPQFLKTVSAPENIKINKPARNFTISFNRQMPQTPLSHGINQKQLSAGKLNNLIKDPYINEIECIGADEPLIIKKSGQKQKTQVRMSIEQIYELIAEFSQKTRIPVVSGSIKAALNNLIITAVLSENLGPRFIIQKINPYQQLI